MSCKITITVLLSICIFSSPATWASEPNDYIIPGRSSMFDGTLSGLQAAYEIFNNGMNDPNCMECSSNGELIFLHAITRITMWAGKDDGAPVDSAIEFLREFDIELCEDYWRELDVNYPSDDQFLNQHDAYEIPESAFDIIDGVPGFIDTSAIPEIDATIAELDLIHDSPGDRFRILFTPDETSIFFSPYSPGLQNDIEVDYGEVLALKGLLMVIKSRLLHQSAYDTFVDADDMLIEKIYGDSFNINTDLLIPHPDLLKVLSTTDDPNYGAALLAHARQHYIDGINYYRDAIDYIRSEDNPTGTDPQENELLYIDPNNEEVFDEIDGNLVTIRDSLLNDTAGTYTFETIKKYDIQCPGLNSIGELDLVLYPMGLEEEGSLTLTQCAGVPSRWSFEYFSVEDDILYIEMDYEDSGINYMQAQSLHLANSLLLTPIECPVASSTYRCDLLGQNLFSETGTAQGWHGDDQSWDYALPFPFPFFDTAYTSVYVCTDGFLDFTDPCSYYWDWQNKIRIEPFGADLETNGGGTYDIYIEQVDPNEVKFRWDADRYGEQCNFSVSLFRDGSIRFDYGPGNRNAWPYVGISNGSYDGSIPFGSRWPAWGSGLFTGTISQDQNSITDVTFEYWGYISGTLNDLSGQITNIEVKDVSLDLNPVFGSSTRYPDPVNPRDLLPEFDKWHGPQPGTIGHGLGDDPTLGGILPDMTQYDWQVLFDLQPGGLFYLDFVSPWQITIDGNMDDWSDAQLVFADISFDTDEDSNDINGVDIENVYMAYDWEYVYGAISLYDEISDPYQTRSYSLTMSYAPDNSSVLDSLKFQIDIGESYSYGNLSHMTFDQWDWIRWQDIADLDFAAGQSAIEFKIPFTDIPTYLPGRFITVKSNSQDVLGWRSGGGEQNATHLRMGELGSISGTVSYNGCTAAPIFVQAFTDHEEDSSIVASIMVAGPGPYILEGIGLGWEGYVKAFTPLFGFDNLFELDAFNIQSCAPVSLMDSHLDNVDIVLNYPTILEGAIWEYGEINTDCYGVDWYAFDAVAGGTYTLDLIRGTADYACMTLYGRDGHAELHELYHWQAQQINWLCPASGRYYVEVADGYYQLDGGTYQIRMMTDVSCPQADIACAEWIGVKDCRVDVHDLDVLISNWLNTCSGPCWCDQSDFNGTGFVDFRDFAILAGHWLEDSAP